MRENEAARPCWLECGRAGIPARADLHRRARPPTSSTPPLQLHRLHRCVPRPGTCPRCDAGICPSAALLLFGHHCASERLLLAAVVVGFLLDVGFESIQADGVGSRVHG